MTISSKKLNENVYRYLLSSPTLYMSLVFVYCVNYIGTVNGIVNFH